MDKLNLTFNNGTTPVLNEINLNKITTKIDEMIDNLYYKEGDTYKPAYLLCTGILTSGNKEVIFTMPTEKRMDGISTITCSSLKCQIRHSDGGYIANSVELSTLGTLDFTKTTNNTLRIRLIMNNASTLTNNCPVNVYIISGDFTFQ